MAITVVFLLLALVLANFIYRWVALEVLATLVMAALAASRVLTPAQAFGGLAGSTVIMIAGIMLLTGGVIHNGAADMIARRIGRVSRASVGRAAFLLLGSVGAMSTMINNVAATAMFIPVAERLARRVRVPRGRFLLPVAYASMMGGMCTLIGTSTNVAVSGALEQHGLAPLGLFELAPVGLAVVAIGLVYLVWGAPRLMRLPAEQDAVAAYGVRPFLYEIVVGSESALAGRSLHETRLGASLGVAVLAIVRGDRRILSPAGGERITIGDLLLVEGESETIPLIQRMAGLSVKSFNPGDAADLESEQVKLVEATVSYNSPFIGRTLKELNFRHRYGLSVLAIHRSGDVVIEKVGRTELRAGDVLLIHGRKEELAGLEQEPTMLLLESVVLPHYHPRRALRAAVLLGATIVTATFGWLDAPTAFLLGGMLSIITGCLTTDLAGSYVNIRFLVMLAGMAALGTAMEASGAAALLAGWMIDLFGHGNPLALMAGFFVLTAALTQPLSNAAAALLVMPLGLNAAQQIGVDARSFAIAIAIAASCSFITPLEPACLLVYDTGRYRLGDFIRAGTPLTILAFLLSILIVPAVWPFHP